ncbi:MAG TPA: hypothetical protein VN819_00405 [Thermoplasmata archaeon]|nr:hypothetical protein [Thermoplasmata archaeon]
MATPRAVRIPRTRSASSAARPEGKGAVDAASTALPKTQVRTNVGGSQRAVRISVLFVGTLALLYAAFILYDRTAPGGTSSPEGNGVLLFTGIFLVFAVAGALYSLTPAPRAVEVDSEGVTVIGRWGRRRRLPRLDLLTVGVVRRYPEGWLSERPVELIELSGEDVRRRSYLVEPDVFAGARSAYGPR